MKYLSIQYLRAIAASFVVIAHASASLLPNNKQIIDLSLGGSGVDLFFVISGFVMYFTTHERTPSPRSFYVSRLIRIFPIYFLLTSLAFVIAVFLPRYTNTFSGIPADYIRSILFIPYENKYGHMRPVIGQGWTLNYEMFFYLVFGVLLTLGTQVRAYACIALFSLLCLAGLLLQPTGIVFATYTDTLMLEFVFGVLIAYVELRHSCLMLPLLSAFSLVTILLAVLLNTSLLPRFLVFGVPSAAIVCAAIALEKRGRIPFLGWFLLAGDASYSLYLTHTFVLAVLSRLFRIVMDISLLVTHIVFISVSLAVSLLGACLFYKMIELPTTTKLRGLVRNTPAPARRAGSESI